MSKQKDKYADKYRDLIDDEIWTFIERTNQLLPQNNTKISVDEQRKSYENLCREFYAGRPAKVSSEDFVVEAPHPVLVRSYEKQNVGASAQVLYVHGGGFVVGSLNSHDDVCAEICDRTGFRVTSVDYRLAPEHLFPGDVEDVSCVFEHMCQSSNLPIVLAGDSAGACIAAAVCHRKRGYRQKPVGQVFLYPAFGGRLDWDSYLEHADAPLLSTGDMAYYYKMRCGGKEPDGWEFAPLKATDLKDIPPTIAIAAECDPLRDDAVNYCMKIVASGGKARAIVEPGLIHGYVRARSSSRRAKESFSRFVEAIETLGTSANYDWT